MSLVTSNDEFETESNVSAIRKLQPGDVLEVVKKLREAMSTIESTAFTIYASFDELGGKALSREAEKTRHTLELAVARMAALTAAVEETDHYKSVRTKILADRDGR